MQQGFLPGCSMPSNIVGVDYETQHASLICARGAVILLDFRAAFPSVSQEFLHRMLDELGLLAGAKWVARNLYCSHRCNISFRDICENGFHIGTGIRQGCPLSPLLFALVVDLALRRIQASLPTAIIRAFADDIALVVKDVDEALPILHPICRDLEVIANLSLNKSKCVLIPLWPSTAEQVERELVTSFPEWAGMQVAFSGTYLGVDIGPGGISNFWVKAVRKYLERARPWSKAGLGLQLATLAYSVYVLLVLGFLAHFKSPNAAALQAEEEALRVMVPGPYKWCRQVDLYVLKHHFGQSRSFPCLSKVLGAAWWFSRTHPEEGLILKAKVAPSSGPGMSRIKSSCARFAGVLGMIQVSYRICRAALVSYRSVA